MRIRLHHEFGAHTGRVHELAQAVIRIGRLPDNDVAFDPQADIDASGRHAEIRFEGGEYWISDAGSRNGTFVNGARVTKHKLGDGDIVECGKGGPRVRVEIPPPSGGAGLGAAEVKRVAVAATVQSDQVAAPPAAPEAAPAAAGPSKKTIGMMIQQALGRGGGKSTAEIHAVAFQAAHDQSRKLKVALFVVTFLLLAAIGGGVGLWWVTREESTAQNDELRAAYTQLFTAQQMDQATRAQVQARVEALNKQLEESSRDAGARIAQQNAQTVFLLVAQAPDGRDHGYCTAFAVSPTVLATNAHCVEAMQQMALQGQQFVALPNGGQGGRFAVTPVGRHPLYMPGGTAMSADVGLVRIAGQWPSFVRMAGPTELAAIVPGKTIFVYGFPGQLNEPRSPVATLTTGIVGRITGFDGTASTPDRAFLVQHSAFTSPGTSGSPVFSDDGLVIAVNAGAYRGSSREQVVDALGQRSEVTITQDLHGYAFGVRVDLAQQLLLGIGGS